MEANGRGLICLEELCQDSRCRVEGGICQIRGRTRNILCLGRYSRPQLRDGRYRVWNVYVTVREGRAVPAAVTSQVGIFKVKGLVHRLFHNTASCVQCCRLFQKSDGILIHGFWRVGTVPFPKRACWLRHVTPRELLSGYS
jgi:hypothetical protein